MKYFLSIARSVVISQVFYSGMVYITDSFHHSCGIGNDPFFLNILNMLLFRFTKIK